VRHKEVAALVIVDCAPTVPESIDGVVKMLVVLAYADRTDLKTSI
jgi:hypothetical protein